MKTYWKQGLSDLEAMFLNRSETPVASLLGIRREMEKSASFGVAMDDSHKKLVYRLINLIAKALSMWGFSPWVLMLISELLRLLYDLVEHYRRKAELEGTANETTETTGSEEVVHAVE
ncbi:MAG TPA: hypothetical protein DCP69_00145 [Candidatus Omnitrophica bacterium]|nr:hypothetical protein [Candidatus Omnitrophota bacterium]